MKYFYDCEFLEDGRTIEPISIGIVTEDGREYYAVFEEIIFNDAVKERIRSDRWLMENVIPHLPLREHRGYEFTLSSGNGKWGNFHLDHDSLLVLPRRVIKNWVRDFILGPGKPVELWAYYGAYDHVMLSQLFGRMIDWPTGMPMWTNDIVQLAEWAGIDGETRILPAQAGTEHNALEDARWVRDAWNHLNTIMKEDR